MAMARDPGTEIKFEYFTDETTVKEKSYEISDGVTDPNFKVLAQLMTPLYSSVRNVYRVNETNINNM